jgi:glutamine phosphoribosylpyrophosphate amidotransferase
MIETKCAFNQIYKLDGDHFLHGERIRDVRRKLAYQMAGYIARLGLGFDYISGIPNTGYLYYNDLALALRCPSIRIFEKQVSERTLGSHLVKREAFYEANLVAEQNVDLNAHVLFVDEALLSGLTVVAIAEACRRVGIRKYSFAFMSPAITCYCPWEHIKHAGRYYEPINSNPSACTRRSLMSELQDRTGAQSILHCPAKRFGDVIDLEKSCTLCFQIVDDQ